MKQQLRKICFYTVDKHVRDLLVSVEKAFFFFFGLADVLSSDDCYLFMLRESIVLNILSEWEQFLSLHPCNVVDETCHQNAYVLFYFQLK